MLCFLAKYVYNKSIDIYEFCGIIDWTGEVVTSE